MRYTPPKHPLVGAFAGLPEPLFAISELSRRQLEFIFDFCLFLRISPLIVLFFGDLLHLNQRLTCIKKASSSMYNKPERERGGVLMKMKPIGDLVQQLSHSKLELRQLLLLCHVGIVDGVLPNLKKKISVTIVKIIIGSVMMIMTQQQHGLWQPFRMSIIQMGEICVLAWMSRWTLN